MRIAGALVGLLLAYAVGALLAWRLWPTRAKPAFLLAALAWPLGLAGTSSAYFLWLVLSGGRARGYPALELALVLALGALAWRTRTRRRARLVLPSRSASALSVAAGLALLVATAVSLFATVRFAEAVPMGYWDAWARINLKARFLYEGGPEWDWIFRADGITHPDYPLLLKASVARLWRWSGGIDPLPAQALSVLNWVACLAALLALVGTFRSGLAAAVAGLLFLCKRPDSWWAAMQYSDFALATHFLWGAGVLALAARRPRVAERWWPLLGFCAGAAAWCKNEGLAFALLLTIGAVAVSAWASPRRGRAGLRLGAGWLLGGLALLVLKLGFAGTSSVFGPRPRPVLEDLFDGSRHRAIGTFLADYLEAEVLGTPLALLALAMVLLPGRRERRRAWLPLVLCAALAGVFLVVMVTTREDLLWHIGTALDRLLLQLWPLAILSFALVARSRG